MTAATITDARADVVLATVTGVVTCRCEGWLHVRTAGGEPCIVETLAPQLAGLREGDDVLLRRGRDGAHWLLYDPWGDEDEEGVQS